MSLLDHAKLAAPTCQDYGARPGFRVESRDIEDTRRRQDRPGGTSSCFQVLSPLWSRPSRARARSTTRRSALSCEWQIAEGTNGLVPVGTTGESPTLSHDEHRSVVKACVEVAKGRVPVIAGAGSNNTAGSRRPRPLRRRGRRRRRSRRHALLQQADPARPLCAFRGRRQGDHAARHHLQHPAALGHRHDAGDDGPARA